MRKWMTIFILPLLLLSFVFVFTASKKETEEAPKRTMEIAEFGDYSGITVNCKLIGGAMYEPLYTRIPEWEEKTGAKVVILSKKNHFDLDREIKQDIAAGTLDWDIGSNHSSFAPQYGRIYLDMNEYLSSENLAPFLGRSLENCTVDGKLVQMPRHGDVSNLFFIKSVFEDEDNKRRFKAEYGYDFNPPETYEQFKDMAIFLTNPPNFYGTQYVGKDEAVAGRFYEILIANGGALFDEDWYPAFDSPEGVKTLNWFIELYEAQAVPPGVLNYLWGDTGMGFASGTIALNMDWAGWGAFFNDPENSKVAGDVGFVRAPKGDAGIRSGWTGWHSFSVAEKSKNKEAALSLVLFLTNYESQMEEARMGLLPSRAQVWDDIASEFVSGGNEFMAELFKTWKLSMAEDTFTPPLIPEWVPFTNVLFPELQAAIVGDKTAEQALEDAAEATERLMSEAGYY
jgi:multiple sugar transport system substrate-binding protein